MCTCVQGVGGERERREGREKREERGLERLLSNYEALLLTLVPTLDGSQSIVILAPEVWLRSYYRNYF